ncbi:ATP-binding protein [Streptomyces rubradiris]|uniref:ATP-binding protein n=1 Tax=Streptomyces rubradiris TaxID=285531 RepID=UPI0035709C9A
MSAARARQLVRAALSVWNLSDLADDGALIVSESVTNAVQHTRRDSIRVVMDRPDRVRARIGVVDFPKARPEREVRGLDDDGGRGLASVGEPAEERGTDPLPWGKRVWAELRKAHG